jgi:hypothetical protein
MLLGINDQGGSADPGYEGPDEMMNFPQGGAALDTFVHDLRRLKHAGRAPSNRELVKLAPEVIAVQREEIRTLRPLTAAVLGDVMSRKRQGPPPWGWWPSTC